MSSLSLLQKNLFNIDYTSRSIIASQWKDSLIVMYIITSRDLLIGYCYLHSLIFVIRLILKHHNQDILNLLKYLTRSANITQLTQILERPIIFLLPVSLHFSKFHCNFRSIMLLASNITTWLILSEKLLILIYYAHINLHLSVGINIEKHRKNVIMEINRVV